MSNHLPEHPSTIADGVQFFRQNFGEKLPKIAVIIGSSGPKSLKSRFKRSTLKRAQLDQRFPHPFIHGHRPYVSVGEVRGTPMILVEGRVHYNENNSMFLTTMMVRVLAKLGVKQIILTNLSGTLNQNKVPVGQINLIAGHHIEGMPDPLSGDPQIIGLFGSRHISMRDAYSKRLRDLARGVYSNNADNYPPLGELDISYVMKEGPTFESVPTAQDLKARGFDVAGMSTAPEVVVCRQMGVEVLAITAVSNVIATTQEEEEVLSEVSHEENIAVSKRLDQPFSNYLADLVVAIGKASVTTKKKVRHLAEAEA